MTACQNDARGVSLPLPGNLRASRGVGVGAGVGVGMNDEMRRGGMEQVTEV